MNQEVNPEDKGPWWGNIALLVLWVIIWPVLLINLLPFTGWKVCQDKIGEPQFSVAITILGWSTLFLLLSYR